MNQTGLADLDALVQFILDHPPTGHVSAARFGDERRRFLEAWHAALPDLPYDEVLGTINAITALAALRGGRS